MKIILLQDVPNLGKAGEIKDVKDGFARNYLLPKNLAEAATGKAIQKILSEKDKKNAEIAKQRKTETQEIESFGGRKLNFQVKINAKGVPYKAITSRDIAEELKIEPSLVENFSVKDLGTFPAKISSGSLSTSVEVTIEPGK
jgi:large subunit ribosomal protein L9